jgi:hypothetical protein
MRPADNHDIFCRHFCVVHPSHCLCAEFYMEARSQPLPAWSTKPSPSRCCVDPSQNGVLEDLRGLGPQVRYVNQTTSQRRCSTRLIIQRRGVAHFISSSRKADGYSQLSGRRDQPAEQTVRNLFRPAIPDHGRCSHAEGEECIPHVREFLAEVIDFLLSPAPNYRSNNNRLKTYRKMMHSSLNPTASKLYCEDQEQEARLLVNNIINSPDQLTEHIRRHVLLLSLRQ